MLRDKTAQRRLALDLFMGTISIIFISIVFGALAFWTLRGKSDIKMLNDGKFGEFEISKIYGALDNHLAFDDKHKKLAFLGARVPNYDQRGNVSSYLPMSFICSYGDVESIVIVLNDTTATAEFRFLSQIPRGNLWKVISFIDHWPRLPDQISSSFSSIKITTIDKRSSAS
jgi:hypothetical protein